MPKYLTVFLLLIFISCHTSDKRGDYSMQSPFIITDNLRTIPVQIEKEDYFHHLDDYLYATSYVKLASDPLLAEIKDIHIQNDRIYIWDRMNRIVCYDMQGNVIFQIDSKGNGPGEYSGINAFALNPDRSEIVVYDNLSVSLLYFSMENGKYLRSSKFRKPNPTEIAFSDHVFFYNNRYHINYANDSLLHYSLLVSADGLKMDKRYFPHNKVEVDYIFSPSYRTFYNNDTRLYYCRNFDNVVYQLGKDTIRARYKIELPNPLPFTKIEQKMNEIELIRSDFTFGISNVYECDDLLHFCFNKSGFIMTALYDLAKDKQLCCVKVLQDAPTEDVPVASMINGVYKGQFYSVLTPARIEYMLNTYPGTYPKAFEQYNSDSDNPVIGFYQVK
ncbi:MAG: 6-bladed beta-propeller [Bacteroides sp.]|nr:6-bladed beta-propeller [Bacteroides sp.]